MQIRIHNSDKSYTDVDIYPLEDLPSYKVVKAKKVSYITKDSVRYAVVAKTELSPEMLAMAAGIGVNMLKKLGM